jgi:hypothetical protein
MYRPSVATSEMTTLVNILLLNRAVGSKSGCCFTLSTALNARKKAENCKHKSQFSTWSKQSKQSK